jgi:hypothetical protein
MEPNIPKNGNEKILNYIMYDNVISPDENNEINVSLLNLRVGRICIEKNHK